MGIEIRPVFRGDFDRYEDEYRGTHQVRINLWGWLGRSVSWLMARSWKRKNVEPDK